MNSLYNRLPLLILENNIPVFSSSSKYIDNYEQIAADHLESISKNGTNPWIEEQVWKEIEDSTIRLIRKYAKEGEQIMDVGVGLGRILKQFPEMMRYGMDISARYLQEAQKEGIQCCLSMAEDMPYKDEVFDMVICCDVLEHVFDLNLAITNILSTLKKGGTLIIRVPYREDMETYMLPSAPYEFIHLRNFDEHTLRLLFSKIFDCEVLYWETVGQIFNWARLKSLLPETPVLKSIVYRYYRFLERFAPAKYARLFHLSEISMVIRKK